MYPDEPYDNESDRTVIRPMPGGRRRGPSPAPEQPRRPHIDDRRTPEPSSMPTRGHNRLLDSAGTLFSLVGQLRGTTQNPNVDTLRVEVEQEIRAFDNAARERGVDGKEASTARYLLCTLIDEAVLRTPWGNESSWNQQTLLAKFHQEAKGGERFFIILDNLQQDARRYIDLLELIYLCLLMGFEGKYKLQERGSGELQSIQDSLFYTIQDKRGAFERELSPHWQGVEDLRNSLQRYVPLWVLGAVLALLLVAVFIGFRLSLSNATEPVFQQLNTIGRQTPLLVAPYKVVRPTEPVQIPKLARLLSREVNAGLITIDDQPDSTGIVIKGDGLFRSGSITVQQRHIELLNKIGRALEQVPGRVLVVGHTDNIPIRSLRFNSNWDLSRQRAESVAELLASVTATNGRFHAEGRADTEPLVPNDGAANRARNRRVEIILFKETGRL